MKIGIVGLPTVGKSTLFNLLTGMHVGTSTAFSGRVDVNVGVAKVPDPRVDRLAEIFRPRKVTYAHIELTEVPGLVRGSSQGSGVGNQFLSAIRNVDALLHVVRAFENPAVLHVDDTIDPVRDIETLTLELVFSDLEIVERRLERLSSSKKRTAEQDREMELLAKCKEALESEVPLRNVPFSQEEESLLRGYAFLTQKPEVLVVNIDENQLLAGDYEGREGVYRYAERTCCPVVEISARIEEEISQLANGDRVAFLMEYGITEPGISRLARVTYRHLGLISFFTVGEDEVKAWTVEVGTDARRAAGKIHSDIEKGFIKAEVVSYDDFIEAGSLAKAREKGVLRLEGKDYIVKDGDIISFRFNV